MNHAISCREIKVVTVREEPVRFYRRGKLDEPKHIFRFWNSTIVRSSWYQEDKEHLVCFCLDTQYALKSFCLVSIGSLNENIAHPREIFRPAVADAAFAVIVAHNHPSGESRPSKADAAVARRLYWAANLLQIRFLDFVVIGDSNYFSLASTLNWPRSTFIEGQRDLSDSYYSPGLADRLTHIHATEEQWRAIQGEENGTLLLSKFLGSATKSQLKRLRNFTPLFFDSHEPPGYFVGVRNFRPTDTRDWQQAKAARALISRRLRHCGIKP